MESLDWEDICSKMADRIGEHTGASFFIENNASFENWVQVELVRILLEKGCKKIEIEKSKNNNVDIVCRDIKIEIKISSKRYRKISGKNSIESDLKKADVVLVVALELEGSDFENVCLDLKTNPRTCQLYRKAENCFPIKGTKEFNSSENSPAEKPGLRCRVLAIGSDSRSRKAQ